MDGTDTANPFDELYREIILDHYKHPRNKADLSHLADDAVFENPSCGDTVKLEVCMDDDGLIAEVRFDGYGCAVSTASASMMSERLVGMTVREARSFISVFLSVLRGEKDPECLEKWGDLALLGGVSQFPLRIKCAALAWHAMEKILPEE